MFACIPGEWLVDMFETLAKSFDFTPSTKCGTAVTVLPRPPNRAWAFDDLKPLGKAIIHFEGAIDVLAPDGRPRNSSCRSSHHDNPNLQGQTGQCFELIDGCVDVPELAWLMSPWAGAYDEYAWSFRDLGFGDFTTRPTPPSGSAAPPPPPLPASAGPGSTSPWPSSGPRADILAHGKTVAGLLRFVWSGIRRCNAGRVPRHVAGLFQDKEDVAEMEPQPGESRWVSWY
jgi:hypothetical protein